MLKYLLIAVVFGVFSAMAHLDRPDKRQSYYDSHLAAYPIPIVMLFGFGDRYLPANFNLIKLSVTDVNDQQNLDSREVIHRQIAYLQPRHEDNYYLGNASLSWEGRFESAQYILDRAADYRKQDPWPYVFSGLNAYAHFDEAGAAANFFAFAASRADGNEKKAFETMAENLFARLNNLDIAISYLEMLSENVDQPSLKQNFELKIERINRLKIIRTGVNKYINALGEAPPDLNALVDSGVLDSLPVDPTGKGYFMSKSGLVR